MSFFFLWIAACLILVPILLITPDSCSHIAGLHPADSVKTFRRIFSVCFKEIQPFHVPTLIGCLLLVFVKFLNSVRWSCVSLRPFSIFFFRFLSDPRCPNSDGKHARSSQRDQLEFRRRSDGHSWSSRTDVGRPSDVHPRGKLDAPLATLFRRLS